MDNIQNCTSEVVVVVLIVVVGYLYSVYFKSNRCEDWSNEMENMCAELDGSQCLRLEISSI
jgi:hypothetical protein